MLLVKKNNLCGKKNIPWGRKDPAVVISGVVGRTGSGSGTGNTRFGGVSAVKKMLLVKKNENID